MWGFFELESLDGLERATLDIVWESESDKELSNDVILVEASIYVGENISGEVRNLGSETVEDAEVTFAGRNSNGQLVDIFSSHGVNFGDDLVPGATGVFQAGFEIGWAETYYYITWGHYDNREATPYTLLTR